MTLLSLDMPSDATELALWLESHLVGHTLGQLVSELGAAHGLQREFQIDHLIRNCKAELLAEGLQSLTGKQLLLLIKNPSLLGDLQELVLTEGSTYWQQQLRNTWQRDSTYQQGARLLHELAGSRSVQPTRKRLARFQDQRWAMRLLATSALLLVGFLGWRLVDPGGGRATAWGWNSPTLFEATDSSVGYLEKLADAAEEWFDDRPATRSELARRLNELRTGCSRLIRADHESLSLADRKWLVARCRDWALKIDESLVQLESGSSPQAVRTQVDQLIRKLSNTLRTRQPATAPQATVSCTWQWYFILAENQPELSLTSFFVGDPTPHTSNLAI